MLMVALVAILRKIGLATFLILGPAFVLVALMSGIHTGIFLSHSIRASGTIIENARIEGTSGQPGTETETTFAPVFRFTARDGKNYVVTSGTSANPPSYAVGQQVGILYLDGEPNTAKIDSIGQLWGFTIGFGICGVVTGVCGLGLLLYERRRKRRRIGFLAGQGSVPHDFDQMGASEIAAMFEELDSSPKN
jgi:hypothetical protein